jgi:hypothetical protein
MNITPSELKTMKVKQLRRLIRESIAEIVLEDAAADKKAHDAAVLATNAKLAADNMKKSELAKNPALTETELDEMARIAKGFRLANPEMNSSSYTKSISGTPLSTIIDYFRENPGAEAKDIQTQFEFVRPQIAQGLVKGLLDAGVLVKMTAGGVDIAPVIPGEEGDSEEAPSWEDQWVGNRSNPLAMYFDDVPNEDGSEDFNDNEEPTIDDEPAPKVLAAPRGKQGMNDEDYAAWEKYDDLQTRLNATKGNIVKLKRRKGGSPGDINDKPSTELIRLRDLKTSLESRIADLVASSEYLRKKEAGELDSDKRQYVTRYKKTEPAIEPVEAEDEIEPLDEWTINKLQYYAGIRK